MKKFLKVMWIVAACMAGVGVLITGFGFSWSMRVVDRLTPDESVPVSFEMDMLTVDAIRIDLGVGDVKFVVDDEARIEATGFAKEDISIAQDGSTVTVEGRDPLGGSHIINLGIFRVDWLGRVHVGSLEKRLVTVYLPKRTGLEVLSVDAGVGNVTGQLIADAKAVTLESSTGNISLEDLWCEEIECRMATGKLTLENVHVTESATVDTGTGKVNLIDGSWKNLVLDGGTGDVKMETRLYGRNMISLSTGKLEMVLEDSAEEYTAKISTSTGDVEVENADVMKAGKHEYVVNDGKDVENSIEIDVSTGDVKVVFGEE